MDDSIVSSTVRVLESGLESVDASGADGMQRRYVCKLNAEREWRRLGGDDLYVDRVSASAVQRLLVPGLGELLWLGRLDDSGSGHSSDCSDPDVPQRGLVHSCMAASSLVSDSRKG